MTPNDLKIWYFNRNNLRFDIWPQCKLVLSVVYLTFLAIVFDKNSNQLLKQYQTNISKDFLLIFQILGKLKSNLRLFGARFKTQRRVSKNYIKMTLLTSNLEKEGLEVIRGHHESQKVKNWSLLEISRIFLKLTLLLSDLKKKLPRTRILKI